MQNQTVADQSEINRYIAYFAAVVRKAYDGTTASGYAPDDNAAAPKPPMLAIESAFAKPWEKSPGWEGLDRKTYMPAIEKWLADNRVTGLELVAHGYHGWTGACFKAQFENSQVPQIVRMAAETGSMPHLSRLWNPLLLQAHSQTIFMHRHKRGNHKLSLERMPIAPMVPPGEPHGFDAFLNQHILAGTPFKVKDHKDLSVFLDTPSIGKPHNFTPVYGDPDSISFATRALARAHYAKDLWDPSWQQTVLRTIHKNSERIGLPPSMRWAVETAPDVYATKQAAFLPDPLALDMPVRAIVRLRTSEPYQAYQSCLPTELTQSSGRRDLDAAYGKMLGVVAGAAVQSENMHLERPCGVPLPGNPKLPKNSR